MTIVHDAYLFKSEEFADAVTPSVEALERGLEGYRLIRSRAIDLYAESPRVRLLSEEYGGWDRAAITAQIPADLPQGSDDVAFWFVLMLYDHLRTEPHRLGLGSNLYLMDSICKVLGWSDFDRGLLVRGRNFKALAQERFLKRDKDFDNRETFQSYWDHIRPLSVNASAGWIDTYEAKRLLDKLAKDKPTLVDPQKLDDSSADSKLIQEVSKSAEEMLLAAIRENYDLCIIVSG